MRFSLFKEVFINIIAIGKLSKISIGKVYILQECGNDTLNWEMARVLHMDKQHTKGY